LKQKEFDGALVAERDLEEMRRDETEFPFQISDMK
jgi:hypothetical protein